MPSSLKLYTTGNMEVAHMHNSPPEATGHPAELALDNNLDTYWKSTSTANVEFQIDLGEAKTVESIMLFIRNYKEISSGSASRWWSDNGSSWTSAGTTNLVDVNTPIRYGTSGLGSTHRYWKIIITSPSHIVELAGIWWGLYFPVDIGNVLPQEDEDQFYNRVSQLPGGRLAVAGINRNRIENFNRRYLIKSDNVDILDLRNAYQDSRGVRHLLIMNEATPQSSARVVRFADDIFVLRLTAPQVYDVQIRLECVPYIDDGDSY